MSDEHENVTTDINKLVNDLGFERSTLRAPQGSRLETEEELRTRIKIQMNPNLGTITALDYALTITIDAAKPMGIRTDVIKEKMAVFWLTRLSLFKRVVLAFRLIWGAR